MIRPGTGPRTSDGVVAIETALTIPLLAVAMVAALQTLGVVRAVLVAQEAARTGARVAAAGDGDAVSAATEALGGLRGRVTVAPRRLRPGDLVVVTVRVEPTLGPLRRPVTARSVAVVEPGAAP